MFQSLGDDLNRSMFSKSLDQLWGSELFARILLPGSKQHVACLDETSTHVHGTQVAGKGVHVVQDKTHPCSQVDHRKTNLTSHQVCGQC